MSGVPHTKKLFVFDVTCNIARENKALCLFGMPNTNVTSKFVLHAAFVHPDFPPEHLNIKYLNIVYFIQKHTSVYCKFRAELISDIEKQGSRI